MPGQQQKNKLEKAYKFFGDSVRIGLGHLEERKGRMWRPAGGGAPHPSTQFPPALAMPMLRSALLLRTSVKWVLSAYLAID